MVKATRYKIQYMDIYTGKQNNIELYANNLEQVVKEFREYFSRYTYRILSIYKEVASDITFNL